MFGRIRGKMATRLSQRTEQNHFGRMLSQITKEQFGLEIGPSLHPCAPKREGCHVNRQRRAGYYITNGKAVAVIWAKTGENRPTVFFDAMTGKPIEINTGKTYIALVPSDSFANIVIQ